MTQTSRPWDGTSTGDAGPYDAPNEWAAVQMGLTNTGRFTNRGGVLFKELNSLALSVAGAAVRVASGRAIVSGTWYENDGNEDVAIPTPAASTRIDRIVLRKDWATQTVRITRIAGVEGGGVPALVQNGGVQWDVPIGSISITTAGVITIRAESLTPGRLYYPVPNNAGPMVSLVRTTNEAIASGVRAHITWESALAEEIDDMWDIATPERVTIRTPGWYQVECLIRVASTLFSVDSEVDLVMGISEAIANYATVDIAPMGSGAGDVARRYFKHSGMYRLQESDYIAFGFSHAGGADLTIVASSVAAVDYPRLDVRYLGPLGVS